jgi:hypothetical protein
LMSVVIGNPMDVMMVQSLAEIRPAALAPIIDKPAART